MADAEDDTEDDPGSLPALAARPLAVGAPGAPSLAAKATSPAASNIDALMQQRQKSVAQMYDDAAQQLQQTYRGPGTNDLLLRMAAAMMQPTASGSFGDALANTMGAVPGYLDSRNNYQDQLSKQLATLRLSKAKDLGDLQEKYLEAQMKAQEPGKVRSGIAPSTGQVMNLDTGAVITPFPSIAPGPEGAAAYAALPPGAHFLDVENNTVMRKPGGLNSAPLPMTGGQTPPASGTFRP